MPWQMKLTDEQGRPRYPFLILDSVSWRGPIITEDEQQRRDEYMPPRGGQHGPGARRASPSWPAARFAGRSRRRKSNGYVGIVKAELAAGEKFPDAVKAGMAAILCSKSFIFLAEGDPSRDRGTRSTTGRSPRGSRTCSGARCRTTSCFALAEAGKAARQGRAGAAGRAHAGRPAVGAVRRLVRHAMAAAAQGRHVSAGQEALPRLRQEPRTEHGRRDQGVLPRGAASRASRCASS